MFIIDVPEAIHNHCVDQLSKHNFGKRAFGNGKYEEQLCGLISQSVVMDLYQPGVWVDGKNGCDPGWDIHYKEYKVKIDVKSMPLQSWPPKSTYRHDVFACQTGPNYDCDVYFFTAYNKELNKVACCGWIDKKQFMEKAIFYHKGDRLIRDNEHLNLPAKQDLYEIRGKGLNQIRSWKDFKMDMFKRIRTIKKL